MNLPRKPSATDTLDAAAAQWLARRDRGLTPAEQDAYLQWLREDPRHGPAVFRLEQAWGALDQLAEWRPAHSPQPNPDLLAPRKRSRIYWLSTAALAAAAAVALLIFSGAPKSTVPAPRQAIIHPGPERLTLEDGSTVELNTGARVEVRYTADTRAVQLLQGEAHFSVAKNPARPFIVTAGQVAVRAVGTAFSVALAPREVSVLVTEGKVQVAEAGPAPAPAGEAPEPAPARGPTVLTAGQQAVINLVTAEPVAAVQDVTPAQVERALSWQGMRLEFVDMPLGNVVADFNRYNRRKLTVADATTAAILVGGNFRADNVEAFVRLLESSFGVTAFRHGDDIVLRRVP